LARRSRGLGDVYKRQHHMSTNCDLDMQLDCYVAVEIQ
jgi:hypothetical protein